MHPQSITDSSFQQKFFSRMVRTEAGCLEWQGAKTKCGYGHVRCAGELLYTHRIVWEIANGSIPDGIHVLHHCDNPSCCNVDHLFLGTHADNMHDRDAKGRNGQTGKFGEKNASHKLTTEQVREIRALYQPYSYEFGQRPLAEQFGVTRTAIEAIVNRKCWTHI